MRSNILSIGSLALLLCLLSLQGRTQNSLPATGNVGIGTSTPTFPLHIKGLVRSEGQSHFGESYDAAWYGALQITRPANVGNSTFHLAFIRAGQNVAGMGFLNNSNVFGIQNGAANNTSTNGLFIDQSGNIGVGTINPENSEGWDRVLDVSGNSYSKILASTSQINTGIWSHNSGYYGAPAGGYVGTATNHPFSIITNKIAKVTVLQNGNVGIGTTTALSKLHVEGGIEPRSIQTVFPASYATGTTVAGLRLSWYSDRWDILANRSGDATIEDFKIARNDQEYFRISKTGNVGIGTATPSAKLSVNGNILAKEIKVKLSNPPDWPDFVFGKDYKTTSLPDVEKFIQTNSHLPNIPSAAEVAKEGINLGEMNAKLLQKIEELTLHLIEQNKRLDGQDRRNEEQQKEINNLKNNKK
ncbi:MAG: hypothetical protein JWQ25_542 [Daejeonella sp.]|nr:hypothetical protein [Daejeonella sp.]